MMQKSKKLTQWKRFLTPQVFLRSFFAVRPTEVVWDTLPKLLSIRVTAEVLGVHPNTLRSWDTQGRLRAVRIGVRHDRRYTREDVRRLYLERRQTPAEEYIVRWTNRRELLNRLRRPWVRPVAVSAMIVAVLVAISSSQFAVADSTERTDIVIPPTRCIGWQTPDHAMRMDVNEAGALDDFSAKNSAVYSTSFDRIASKSLSAVTTAGLDGIDPTITCSGFSVSDLPSDAVLEKPELTVSFIGRAEGTTAGSFAVEATTDGTNWKTYAIIPAHTEKPGRQTFTLATDISRASYTQLQVRLRPDIDIDSPTINAFLDGIALRVTSVTTAPLSPQKNKQAKNALDKLVDFSQNTYASTEEPVVTVPKKETRKFLGFTIKKVAWTLDRVEVLDTHDKTTATKYHVADQAKGDEVESVLKMDMASLHPGKYIVHVTMHNDEGGEAMIEREILWGVVALNFERASPQPKDEVRVGMGILDDLGRTICNADVTVKVRDPRGRTTTYDWTKQTITRNPNCVDKGVTNEPDYHFTFTPNLKGNHSKA
jgi:hypothetical protein